MYKKYIFMAFASLKGDRTRFNSTRVVGIQGLWTDQLAFCKIESFVAWFPFSSRFFTFHFNSV